LKTKELVFGLLILRETWLTFDKNPPKRLEVWTHKKNSWFCKMSITTIDDQIIHFRGLYSNHDVIVVEEHLKLV
jgi:hypothetical protein